MVKDGAAVHCFAWQIGGEGYDMVLSGQVPATIMAKLPIDLEAILDGGSKKIFNIGPYTPVVAQFLTQCGNALDYSARPSVSPVMY